MYKQRQPPDSEKLSEIQNYPVPHDKDSTKRFVAFANYYRKFYCQRAFEKLKNCLSNPPILAYPNFIDPFILTVDASSIGCGAVLSQDVNGSDLPIAYASKTFNHAESKKAPIEQELIAIHLAIHTGPTSPIHNSPCVQIISLLYTRVYSCSYKNI